ncbi:MAG: hypothetical protein M1816_004980 [Peltula sp. TS41687]|nr:MAG: hypothetical protein M1816_004980 [Peltula sp. TS41687]
MSRASSTEAAPAPATCGSGERKGAYNTPLHVIALLLILVLSTLACSFPIIVRRLPRLPVPHRFLFLSRHFGTGVLIATAFVHLLPTAFVSLTDPCLPPFWNKGYPAMAGLIAMTSVLVVVGIEMFFASRGAGHMHAHAGDHEMSQQRSEDVGRHGGSVARKGGLHAGPGINGTAATTTTRTSDGGVRGHVPNGDGGGSVYYDVEEEAGRYVIDDDDEEEEEEEEEDADHIGATAMRRGAEETESLMLPPRSPAASSHHHDDVRLPDHDAGDQQEKKLLLQCLLLEAGILFHSVFIGMALSVATGTSFIVLLVAISFHQTFEGLALGSRIAGIPSLRPTSLKPWLMALAYGTTTPIGQAIGLLVHNLYDPASQMGLLTVGITNAVSSGLLLFAGLVELLAEDFLSDKSYVVLRGRKRLEACAAVAAGGLLMALVGAWA